MHSVPKSQIRRVRRHGAGFPGRQTLGVLGVPGAPHTPGKCYFLRERAFAEESKWYGPVQLPAAWDSGAPGK